MSANEPAIEENSCIVRLANCWLIMNPGGGSTPGRPVVKRMLYRARATGLAHGGRAEQAPAGREAGRADGR
jgi:hypothetical protein